MQIFRVSRDFYVLYVIILIVIKILMVAMKSSWVIKRACPILDEGGRDSLRNIRNSLHDDTAFRPRRFHYT
jgi:hypothetical protein